MWNLYQSSKTVLLIKVCCWLNSYMSNLRILCYVLYGRTKTSEVILFS